MIKPRQLQLKAQKLAWPQVKRLTRPLYVDCSYLLLSEGRWNIRLHVERAIPEKVKTLLYLTAYGTFGRSEMIPFPDDFEATAGAECSFNVSSLLLLLTHPGAFSMV